MALVVGTNTYATLATIQDYLSERGYTTVVADDDVLRAMDYIETMNWVSEQVDEDSDLFWGDDAPDGVIAALCHATRIEASSTKGLMADSASQMKSFNVDVIGIVYESGGPKKTYPIIERMLRGYTQPSGTMYMGLA